MLIIPVEGKISWQNPPNVTIFLILINCFIFFCFQLDEGQKSMEICSDYVKSGLGGIELPRYVKYLKDSDRSDDLADEYQKLERSDESKKSGQADNARNYNLTFVTMQLMMNMEHDSDFMDALYKESVVSKADPDYAKWKSLRTDFDKNKERLVTYKYGLIPARLKIYTLITSMFLHGGLWHLLGNMVFLWIVGCLLEMGCGRIIYGIGYLLVGLCASLFYYIVHHSSYVPAIGASGAISGLMGALTVLYGVSRIKVFFSTGFYFNTIKIPAIILLPFWIGTQFLEFFFGANEQVAYMMHVGGLFGGAGLGFAAKRFFSQTQKTYFTEPVEDKTPLLLEQALAKIGRLDYAGARPLLLEFLSKKPERIDALDHLFTIDKQRPNDPAFHETARRLLSGLANSRSDAEKAWKVYGEYEKISRKPDLPMELQFKLSSVFCEGNHPEDAQRLVESILSKRPDYPNLPTLILRLIRSLEKTESKDKAQQYRTLLCEKYPMSQEARMIKS